MNIHLKNSILRSVVVFFLFTTTLFANQDRLFRGIKKGSLGRVKKAIEQGADVTKPDKQGLTALHWAVLHNNKRIVNFLINKTKARMGTTYLRFITENKTAFLK